MFYTAADLAQLTFRLGLGLYSSRRVKKKKGLRLWYFFRLLVCQVLTNGHKLLCALADFFQETSPLIY